MAAPLDNAFGGSLINSHNANANKFLSFDGCKTIFLGLDCLVKQPLTGRGENETATPNSKPSDCSSSPVEAATFLRFNSKMEEKSKILIIGATGYLGFHLAQASSNSSHPTFALIRDSTFSSPHKLDKLRALSDAGVKFLKVSLFLHSRSM